MTGGREGDGILRRDRCHAARIYRTLGLKEPAGANLLLVAIEQHVQQAVASFSMTNPAASAPALARGLTATRAALAKLSGDVEVAHVLRLKERQFVDALTTALGVTVSGLAVPAGAPIEDRRNRWRYGR